MRVARLFLFLAWLGALPAAIVQNPMVRTVVSASGQFIVQGPPPGMRGFAAEENSTNVILRLNADQLAVMCERVKSVFLRELNFADLFWLSKIHVNVMRYGQPDQPINIASVRYTDGWLYQVDVPERIAPERLVRGLVHVLFLEIANRTASDRSAEVPTWLVEGMTHHLLLAYRAELVVQPQTAMSALVRWDPLSPTRTVLQKEKPLSFAEIGRPTAELLAPSRLRFYQACCQLLLLELRQLPAGHDSIAAFLGQLSRNLNWEVAFLRGFSRQFGSLLEVEKWWALALVGFTGRDPSQIWPARLVPAKLEQLLTVSVRTAPNTNALPKQALYSLQDVIRSMDYTQQRNLVRQKINQLIAARVNVAGDNLTTVLSYQRVLEEYIAKRDRVGFAPVRRGQLPGNPKSIAEEAVKKLDALDSRRPGATARPVPAR